MGEVLLFLAGVLVGLLLKAGKTKYKPFQYSKTNVEKKEVRKTGYECTKCHNPVEPIKDWKDSFFCKTCNKVINK